MKIRRASTISVVPLLNDYKIVEIMSKIKVFKSQDFSSIIINNNIISQIITVISMNILQIRDRSTRQELIKQAA